MHTEREVSFRRGALYKLKVRIIGDVLCIYIVHTSRYLGQCRGMRSRENLEFQSFCDAIF